MGCFKWRALGLPNRLREMPETTEAELRAAEALFAHVEKRKVEPIAERVFPNCRLIQVNYSSTNFRKTPGVFPSPMPGVNPIQ